MRSLISLAILLIAGLVVYNYFTGSSEERENSQEIINSGKDLVGSVWDLLVSEKQKLDNGEYDGAIEDAQKMFSSLREVVVKRNDTESQMKLDELDQRRLEISNEMRQSDEVDPELRQKMRDLMKDTEELVRSLGEN